MTSSSTPPPASFPRPPRLRRRSNRIAVVLIAGTLLTLAIVAAARATTRTGPLWQVVLAIGACVYLWWLGALLFDLIFVWQRYIQQDAAMQFLRRHVQREDFHPRGDPPADEDRGTPADLPPKAPTGAPTMVPVVEERPVEPQYLAH